MAYEAEATALSEPVVISCLQLIDGDVTVLDGTLYFTGWEFIPGIDGSPDERRIAVRLALPASAALMLALKSVRALMPKMH